MCVGQTYPQKKLAMRAGPPMSRAGREQLAALGHRRAGPADRICPVEVVDRIDERRRGDWSDHAECAPCRMSNSVDLAERRMRRAHLLAQFRQRIKRQWLAERAR